MRYQRPLPQLKIEPQPVIVGPPIVPPSVPQPLPPDARIPVIVDIIACVGDFYDVDIGNATPVSITAGELPAGIQIVGERLTGIFTEAICNNFTISRGGFTQEVKVAVVSGNIFVPTKLSQNNDNADYSGDDGCIYRSLRHR